MLTMMAERGEEFEFGDALVATAKERLISFAPRPTIDACGNRTGKPGNC